MADRSVSVRLKAEVSGYMASLRTASAETRKFGDGIMQSATRNRAEFETVGRGLLGIGTAAVAGLGLAVKAAIDWESAWAGVEKTVDGTTAEMAALEDELREMAKSLPATHEEIAAVAEAAGQLGVKRQDIAEFTKTMIDLGETTNLSAEEAATGLARFSNIMGTTHSDVDRLGSVLVDLGNNAATTEAEILELGTRLAAAGKIAGLSESDVFAFASTLTSVGVEAEAGGTALSKVFTSVRDAVLSGSDELDTFARVAGTTAKDFARSFEEDPARAIGSFIEGLGRMNDSGKSTTEIFEELSLTDQRLMRALLSTASAGDLLTKQLDLGAKAWLENTALTEEAEKRYQTAAAQISMAWNKIRDAAIEVGSVLAPIVGGIIDSIGNMADAFGKLPTPVKIALGAIGGIGGALSLAGGSMLLLLPRIAETKRAMQTLGFTSGVVGGKLKGFGKAAGIVGGAFIGLQAAGALVNSVFRDELPGNIDAVTLGLQRWAEEGRVSGEAARLLGDDTEKLGQAFGLVTRFDHDLGLFMEGLVGGLAQTSDSMTVAAKRIETLDGSLAQMVSAGNAAGAAEAFKLVADVAADAGLSTDELTGLLPEYTAAQEVAAEETGKAAGEFGELAGETDAATTSLDNYIEANKRATDPVFALVSALEAVDTAQSDFNEAVKEYGKKSPEAETAALDLAKAVADAENAALDGEISYDAFKGKLRQWVDQGVITAGQARIIRDRVKDARKSAEDYKGNYNAKLKAETRQANSAINGVKRNLNSVDGRVATSFVETFIDYIVRTPAPKSSDIPLMGIGMGGRGGRGAHGGEVRGPGTGTSDTAGLFALSNGEWIIKEKAVSHYGPAMLEAINDMRFKGGMAGGGAVRMAGGGAVRSTPTMAGTTVVQNITVQAPHYVGSHDELAAAIKKRVRTDGGGDVQRTFGR